MTPEAALVHLVSRWGRPIEADVAELIGAWIRFKSPKIQHAGGPAPWAGAQWVDDAPSGAAEVAILADRSADWVKDNVAPGASVTLANFKQMLADIEEQSIALSGSPTWLC